MCNATNIVIRGKFIEINSNSRKHERSQINDYSFYIKKLQKRRAKESQIKQKKEL